MSDESVPIPDEIQVSLRKKAIYTINRWLDDIIEGIWDNDIKNTICHLHIMAHIHQLQIATNLLNVYKLISIAPYFPNKKITRQSLQIKCQQWKKYTDLIEKWDSDEETI